jgi:hypothetical protein
MSFSISVRLPKHAKPAFFVLAPEGKVSLSKMAMVLFGLISLIEIAVESPTIPPPMII